MTTTNTVHAPFAALAPVSADEVYKLAAGLIDDETAGTVAVQREALLCAINGARMGLFAFSVAVQYTKQTKAKPRIQGTHYLGLPGVKSDVHFGTLVAAPTNKTTDEVYLRLRDMSRADGTDPAAWTSLKLSGIKTFQVRGALPGPLAPKFPTP